MKFLCMYFMCVCEAVFNLSLKAMCFVLLFFFCVLLFLVLYHHHHTPPCGGLCILLLIFVLWMHKCLCVRVELLCSCLKSTFKCCLSSHDNLTLSFAWCLLLVGLLIVFSMFCYIFCMQQQQHQKRQQQDKNMQAVKP